MKTIADLHSKEAEEATLGSGYNMGILSKGGNKQMKIGKQDFIQASMDGNSSHSIAQSVIERFRDFGECRLNLNGYGYKTYKIIGRDMVCKNALMRAEYRGQDKRAIPINRSGQIVLISEIVSVEYRGLVADILSVKRGLLKLGASE